MSVMTTPAVAPRANPERLAEDRELYEQLRADKFTGPRFLQLRDDLWVYGWKVLRAWMRDGSIIERCRERDICFKAPYTEVEEMMRHVDVRDEIAHRCVSETIATFMDGLRGEHHWRPDGGATMRTYFIAFCLYGFRDAFRHWSAGHRRRLREALDGIWRGSRLDWDRPGLEMGFENRLMLQDTLSRVLEGASMEEQAICQLILSWDASQEQIAEQLGLTRKAVERRMARLRKRAQVFMVAADLDMVLPSVQTRGTR